MLHVSKLLCEGLTGGEAASLGDDPRQLPPALLHFVRQKRPVVVWSLTRACNLSRMHCYASARTRAFQDELSTAEGEALLDDLAGNGRSHGDLLGGERLLRPDLFHLARDARGRGIRTVLSTNGTLVDEATAGEIREAGFQYVDVSLDGLAAVHDRVRGKKGSF